MPEVDQEQYHCDACGGRVFFASESYLVCASCGERERIEFIDG